MWQIADSIWNIASVVHRAFSAPWSGTPEQWLMVFTGLCFLFLIVVLLHVWQREGGAILLQRFRDMPRQIALVRAQRPHQTTSSKLLKPMVWILMGMLVASLLRSFAMQ